MSKWAVSITFGSEPVLKNTINKRVTRFFFFFLISLRKPGLTKPRYSRTKEKERVGEKDIKKPARETKVRRFDFSYSSSKANNLHSYIYIFRVFEYLARFYIDFSIMVS